MAISDDEIKTTLLSYLDRRHEERGPLAEPARLLEHGAGFASRRSYAMHATVGALLTRNDGQILLIDHRAYGITLQPGGHLEPADRRLVDAAVRELAEETGVDPAKVVAVSPEPVYVEYGQVPARPAKGEPAHFHLDFGFAFTTAMGDVGTFQESEVTGAAWYPLHVAERLVGPRIARASAVSRKRGGEA